MIAAFIGALLAGIASERCSATSAPDPWTNPLSREGFLRSRAQLEI